MAVKKLLKDLKSFPMFCACLQACFESSPESVLQEEVWSYLQIKTSELSEGQILSACKHVLLYLHTLLDMQSQVSVNEHICWGKCD